MEPCGRVLWNRAWCKTPVPHGVYCKRCQPWLTASLKNVPVSVYRLGPLQVPDEDEALELLLRAWPAVLDAQETLIHAAEMGHSRVVSEMLRRYPATLPMYQGELPITLYLEALSTKSNLVVADALWRGGLDPGSHTLLRTLSFYEALRPNLLWYLRHVREINLYGSGRRVLAAVATTPDVLQRVVQAMAPSDLTESTWRIYLDHVLVARRVGLWQHPGWSAYRARQIVARASLVAVLPGALMGYVWSRV